MTPTAESRTDLSEDDLSRLPLHELSRDPVGWFDEIRERTPLFWHEPTATWYVTRYDDVVNLLTSAALSAKREQLEHLFDDLTWARVRPMREFMHRWPVFSDPPRHTVMRRALHSVFRPDRLQSSLALLDRHLRPERLGLDTGTLSVVERGVAGALASLLELDEASIESLQAWSGGVMGAVSLDGFDEARVDRGEQAYRELMEFTAELCENRSGELGTALARAMATDEIDLVDAAATLAQVITGTLEPTVSVAAVALELIGASPDRMGVYANDPHAFVVEVIRLASPFHLAPRYAEHEMVVAGRTVPPNSHVALALVAANRDPRHYGRPGEFDPSRGADDHLAFGRGRHACLGARFATMILMRVLDRLDVSAGSDTAVAFEWQRSYGLRKVLLP